MAVNFKQLVDGKVKIFPQHKSHNKSSGGYTYRSALEPVKGFKPYDVSDTENRPSVPELRKAYREYQFTGCEREFDQWWEFGRRLMIHKEPGGKYLNEGTVDWITYRNAVLDWHYMELHREDHLIN